MKTFCFKLYHSDHNNALMSQINIAGLIFNHCIALHKRYYRLFGKHIQVYQLMKHLTKLKRTKRFAYMRKLGSQAVQNIAERIDRAYTLFFANLKRKVRTSPPKFKEGKVKTLTVKRDAVGDIYIYLVCDSQLEQVKLRTGKSVGFDFGLKTFLTASDGHDIVSPYFFMQNIKSIRSKCRKLSRRKKGSHNRERYRKELARA